MTDLPKNHAAYTDKYFLRSKDILEQEDLNPFVRAQVFIRKGPGTLAGIDEAVEMLSKCSPLEKNGGRVFALKENDTYDSKETLMVIEARVQDIITLETEYLGVLSAATTLANGGKEIDLADVTRRTKEVVAAASGRPVTYFGARHWRFDKDAAIARAAYEGGATAASTDIGAATFGKEGVGTIPHALMCIYAWKSGAATAVVEATKAFDRHMNPAIPRVGLTDYNNHEVDDSVATADALTGRLAKVRLDTCGENVPQGGLAAYDLAALKALVGRDVAVPAGDEKYWFGKGVTVTGTYAVRKGLDDAGHNDCGIMLTSGFGDAEKVRAFVRAEKILGTKLFDSLGVGGLYESRMATMDIVAVGDDLEHLVPISKVGRPYRPNARLEQVLGQYSANKHGMRKCSMSRYNTSKNTTEAAA